MVQYQHAYENEEDLALWLGEIAKCCKEKKISDTSVLFRIYTDSCDPARVEPIRRNLSEYFPGCCYIGSSSSGNILEGTLAAAHIMLSCTLFEDRETKLEVCQLPFTYECQDASARQILDVVKARPWVKGIEMMATVGGVDLPRFFMDLAVLPEQIQLYGGGALATDVHDGNDEETFLFSSAGDPSSRSAVFLLLGGENLFIHTQYVTGWRRLGLPFEVTKAQNNVLRELDHRPALDVYTHFLHVPKDEHYFDMAVVFPFAFESDGNMVLRVSTNFQEDGSMILGADIQEHTKGNIAYGDPLDIMNSVTQSLSELEAFRPQEILLFSCASRLVFWGPEEVSRETRPFTQLAPVSGFFTSGEFLRSKKDILLHNVSIVVASLREGEAVGGPVPIKVENTTFSRPVEINHCLTSFINAATQQLQEANQRLADMAITDGLTGLFNRARIEQAIRQAMADYQKNKGQKGTPIVMMADLDHFKHINDTYGHQEGDIVLKTVADLFQSVIQESGVRAEVGRWGGEEFMFLLHGLDAAQAGKLADDIRTRFSETVFEKSGSHTLSAGIALARPDDTADTLCSRADQGLYLAKANGRNRTVVVSIV